MHERRNDPRNKGRHNRNKDVKDSLPKGFPPKGLEFGVFRKSTLKVNLTLYLEHFQ